MTAAEATGKALLPLCVLKRRNDVSAEETAIYVNRLEKVPLPILTTAVARCVDTMVWFPTVAELLQTCEKVRLAMRASVKFQPCVQCEQTPGWVGFNDAHGDERLKRCDCYLAHQAKVQAGVPDQPLALPSGEEE